MKTVKLYSVYLGEELKLETILEAHAQEYMQTVYQKSGVLCQVSETEITPQDHR